MSPVQHRVVGFAGSVVLVESEGDRAESLAGFLFDLLPSIDPSRLDARFRLESSPSGLALLEDGSPLYDGPDEAFAAGMLIERVMFRLADRSTSGLLLHAGALAYAGRGILLPGKTHSGKTTLAAWLATRGCDYLTDELVFIGDGSRRIEPFTRPLQLRPASRLAIERHAGRLPEEAVRCGGHLSLVLPDALRPGSRTSTPDLALLLFPRYDPKATCEVRSLSSARAGLALMECLLNARNLPEHGFPAVSGLARSAPAFAVDYSDVGQVEQAVTDVLRRVAGAPDERRP